MFREKATTRQVINIIIRLLKLYCTKNCHIITYLACYVRSIEPVLFRYENWLNGKDYGRHPEEPNAKLSPAPPPTAEEFMVNNKNKDKEIPLCLLEPKSNKKRRHPIHKTKNAGKQLVMIVMEKYLNEV